MSLPRHRSCRQATVFLALGIACASCGDGGPCGPWPTPETATYHVTSAPDPDLVGATVQVTADQVVIQYTRDGVPITVTYRVGHNI